MDVVGGSEQEDREELTGLVFTKPTQLLNIYIDCEEQCLSLIQHAQINEESLESVEKRIQETRVHHNIFDFQTGKPAAVA